MRKIGLLLLTALLTLSVLAACSKSNESSSESPGAASSGNPPSEIAKITFMRTGTPELIRQIFEPIIADFEAKNPDIKVELQDLGWGDAEKSLGVMASSQTLPDVMYHLPGTIFDMADKGLILDLAPYLDDELSKDIFPSLLAAGQYDGKQYVIPSGASTLLLWYNTEIFKEAGLDPAAPPKTWDELLAAAKAIKEKTGIPGLGMYSKPAGGETSFVFESFVASAIGGRTWDPSAQEYSYADPAVQERATASLKLIQDLTAYAQDNIAEYGRFDTRTLLRDGKVGMVFDVINMQNQIKDQLEAGTIAVAQIPAGPSGKNMSAVNMGGWFIPTNSKHPDAAWKFLRFLMETDNQIKHTTYGSVPILISEAASYTSEYWKTISRSVNDSVAEGVSPKTNALWTVTGDELQRLMLNKQTPEETLANINKKHADILK